MNVFIRELKTHRKGLIAWSAGIAALMWLCLVKFQTISADPAATTAVLSQMSDTVKAIFGMSGLDAVTLGGYFGICFIFLAILLAVHAALLGTGLLTIEPLTKTTEFLYTKPVGRRRIVTEKLLSGLLQLTILWGVTYLASWGSIAAYASMDGFEATLAVFMAAAALIQLVCFSLGLLTAALLHSAGRAGSVVTGFIFASYALALISQLQGWEWLRYASIFRYFEAADILRTGLLQPHYVLICLVFSALAVTAVYLRYPHRDLTV